MARRTQRYPPPPQYAGEHQHVYREIAVYHPTPAENGASVTQVLHRCVVPGCTEKYTATLQGIWSIDHVRGLEDRSEQEVQQAVQELADILPGLRQ